MRPQLVTKWTHVIPQAYHAMVQKATPPHTPTPQHRIWAPLLFSQKPRPLSTVGMHKTPFSDFKLKTKQHKLNNTSSLSVVCTTKCILAVNQEWGASLWCRWCCVWPLATLLLPLPSEMVTSENLFLCLLF